MLPSTLQSNNNELFEVLELLKENKGKLESSISELSREESEILDKINKLNSELSSVRYTLQTQVDKKSELEILINDTEIAYQKIIESSSSLLKVLKAQLHF